VSGKVWKAPGFKAGTYKSAVVGTSWEKKMAAKAAKQQFSEHKSAAVEALKAKRKAKADERAAAKERKQRNQAKSAVVQKVTAAAAKRMMKSKKQRKLLRTADTAAAE
jgi:rRNA-processing protein CGR1